LESKAPSEYEQVYRLELANHSHEVLERGKIEFGVKYNNGQKGGSCFAPANSNPDQTDTVLIPPLDPGKTFEFYAVNQSNFCSWLVPPNSITAKMSGDEAERTLPLTFDKNPLYAAGAPVFQATTIKWKGLPTRNPGYRLMGTLSESCETTNSHPPKSQHPLKTSPPTNPIHWTEKNIPSDDKAWKFSTLLTIQTDQEIESPKFRIVCDSACSFGRFDMGRDAVTGTDRQDDDRTVVVGIWGSFTPRTPITVVLYGNKESGSKEQKDSIRKNGRFSLVPSEVLTSCRPRDGTRSTRSNDVPATSFLQGSNLVPTR
jgi:hypothetical protein